MSLRDFPPNMMDSTVSTGEGSPLLNHSTSRQNDSRTSAMLTASRKETSTTFPLVCVILTVLFERITYYSILANLLLFLTGDLGFHSPYTVVAVFIFTGFTWLMSTVGGLIGDTVSGRYNAIWGSLLIYAYGAIILPVAALLSNHYENILKWDADYSRHFLRTIVLIALFIISVGEGAYKANIAAFGADQLTSHDESVYRKFFNYFYWSVNLGSLVAYSAIAYIQQIWGFFIGLSIPFVTLLLALLTFSLARFHYIVNPTVESILTNIFNIIKEAHNRKKERGESERYPGMEHCMPIRSWLDRAMMKYGGSYLDSEVEDVKSLRKIIIIFVVLIPYWTTYFQMNTTFLLQGVHMKIRTNTPDANSTIIPAPWLTIADVAFVIVLIPILDKFVYPALERCGFRMTVLARISLGLLFAMASMVVAGFLELKRERYIHEGKIYNQTINGMHYVAADLWIMWQIPQYALIGVGEVFASIGGLEFAYREAPKSMQSFVMGLFYLVQSFGSLLGAGLFAVIIPGDSWKVTHNSDPHIHNLGYYFFLLAGIAFVTWVVFLLVSYRFGIRYSQQRTVLAVQARTRHKSDKMESSSYASIT